MSARSGPGAVRRSPRPPSPARGGRPGNVRAAVSPASAANRSWWRNRVYGSANSPAQELTRSGPRNRTESPVEISGDGVQFAPCRVFGRPCRAPGGGEGSVEGASTRGGTRASTGASGDRPWRGRSPRGRQRPSPPQVSHGSPVRALLLTPLPCLSPDCDFAQQVTSGPGVVSKPGTRKELGPSNFGWRDCAPSFPQVTSRPVTDCM